MRYQFSGHFCFTTVPSFFQTVPHAIFILDTLFTTTKYFCPKTSNESMVLDILAALDDFLVLVLEIHSFPGEYPTFSGHQWA